MTNDPNEKRRGINRIVEEIATLSSGGLPASEYFGRFLDLLLRALAAPAGAIWGRTPQGNLQLWSQINYSGLGLQDDAEAARCHQELLRQVFQEAKPRLVPAHSMTRESLIAANLSRFTLLIVPILMNKEVAGLVEVWQNPERSPQAQRGMLQFMTDVAEYASQFLRGSRGPATMSEELRALLKELETEGRANDATATERKSKMLNLDPDAAQLVSILIRSSRRSKVLEIGTSNGYSTIWLAWSVLGPWGNVVSIDHNPDKHVLAERNLVRAGLRPLVELRCGDALEIIKTLPGPFDAVFFDADRVRYTHYLQALLPKLTPEVLLLTDNVLSHAEECVGYLQALAARPEFQCQTVPVGKGLQIAYRSGGSSPRLEDSPRGV